MSRENNELPLSSSASTATIIPSSTALTTETEPAPSSFSSSLFPTTTSHNEQTTDIFSTSLTDSSTFSEPTSTTVDPPSSSSSSENIPPTPTTTLENNSTSSNDDTTTPTTLSTTSEQNTVNGPVTTAPPSTTDKGESAPQTDTGTIATDTQTGDGGISTQMNGGDTPTQTQTDSEPTVTQTDGGVTSAQTQTDSSDPPTRTQTDGQPTATQTDGGDTATQTQTGTSATETATQTQTDGGDQTASQTLTDTTSPTVTETDTTSPTATETDTISPTATETDTSSPTTNATEVDTASPTTTESNTTIASETPTSISSQSVSQSQTENGPLTITIPQSALETDVRPSASVSPSVSIPAATLSSASFRSLSLSISITPFRAASGALTAFPATETDVLDDLDISNIDLLPQAAATDADSVPLDLSSLSVGDVITTTHFLTSTLSNGDVTLIPTLTSTITSTVKPTSTIQPGLFQRSKGAVVGVIIAASLFVGAGIFIGIWLCRRRKRDLDSRRKNPSHPGGDHTGRVLIRGHTSPASRSSLSRSGWQPPLASEVDDEDVEAQHHQAMSQRSGAASVTAYRDLPSGGLDVGSLSRQEGALHFGTSLLSFDSENDRSRDPRFSVASSLEGGVRTASLISLSAEPTPLDAHFPRADLLIPHDNDASPFADSFGTRDTYDYSSHASPSRRSSTSPSRSQGHGSTTGWKEATEEDEYTPLPQRRSSSIRRYEPSIATNPFVDADEDVPSLMSQMSMLSTTSLLNPPSRPRLHERLTDYIHRSKPPTLPPIPAVVTPALTDDSFHPEGLLANPAFLQSGQDRTHSDASFESLLDHVDYSRPILTDPLREEPMQFENITFTRMSSTSSGASEDPFKDPGSATQQDFLNDVGPVLSMIKRSASASASRASLVSNLNSPRRM